MSTDKLTVPGGALSGLVASAVEYMVDAGQRSALFLDVLRQRGDQYREHLAETAPGEASSGDAASLPILAGLSRKSMLGAVTGRHVASERVAASLAAAVCAAERGAAIIRVHDVAQTVDALKIWSATRAAARRS